MERLGRYELAEVLGRGGMATVHAGYAVGEAGFRKPVVIKRIHTHLTQQREVIQLLIREARITVRLDHPNIVQVLELGRHADEYFVVLERVDGCDLQQLLVAAEEAGTSLPPELAAHVVREVLAGLQHAHGARDEAGQPLGVVHRDVSPSNVMIGRDGRVRLTDFGIAGSVAEATRGGLKGKLSYMSPEQAHGRVVGPASDLYSTALVLLELLTGDRALSGDDDMVVLGAAQQGALDRVDEALDGLPPALAAVLRRALQPDPWNRYRDAEEMRDALAPAAYELEQGRGKLVELLALLDPAPAHVLASGDLETATPPDAPPTATVPLETIVTRSGPLPTGGGARPGSLATTRTLALIVVAALVLAFAPRLLRPLWSGPDETGPSPEVPVQAQDGHEVAQPEVEDPVVGGTEPIHPVVDHPAPGREASPPEPIPAAPAEPALPGTLSVVVIGATAAVTVDAPGWRSKDTPFGRVDVPPGTWHVRVSNPHLGLDRTMEIVVAPGVDVELSFRQAGDAWVETLTHRSRP